MNSQQSLLNRRILLFSICFCIVSNLFAQLEPGIVYWGFRVGPSYRWFEKESLVSTIMPTYNQSDCEHVEQKTLGLTLGFNFNYRKDLNPFGVELEMNYNLKNLGTKIDKVYDLLITTYHNGQVNSNTYYQFNYQYLNIVPIVKFFPIIKTYANRNIDVKSGFHALVGAQLSLNTGDKIDLWSDVSDPNTILLARDAYRAALKGQNYIALIGGLGWESIGKSPLSVEARYYWGLNDTIETQANNLDAVETRNRQHYFELTLGLSFIFFDK